MGYLLCLLVPSTIVCSVETSYPAPEDLALGLLYVGANVTAIPMTFIGQVLLAMSAKPGPAPFFPYSFFTFSTMVLALIPIVFFRGKSLRLAQDQGEERLLGGYDNTN
jgi:hypothetical protein